MKSEVEHFERTNAHLKLFVNDFNLKLQGMKKEIFKQDEIISKNDQYIKAFENDLADVYQHINDYKKLKSSLINLYNKYVQNDTKKLEVNVDKQKAFIEQRAYLETCIATLKDKFKKNMGVHKQDNKRIMKENVDLIGAINELKRENKLNKQNEKLLKLELESIDQAEEMIDEDIDGENSGSFQEMDEGEEDMEVDAEEEEDCE